MLLCQCDLFPLSYAAPFQQSTKRVIHACQIQTLALMIWNSLSEKWRYCGFPHHPESRSCCLGFVWEAMQGVDSGSATHDTGHNCQFFLVCVFMSTITQHLLGGIGGAWDVTRIATIVRCQTSVLSVVFIVTVTCINFAPTQHKPDGSMIAGGILPHWGSVNNHNRRSRRSIAYLRLISDYGGSVERRMGCANGGREGSKDCRPGTAISGRWAFSDSLL
jgi:hypothetical protein